MLAPSPMPVATAIARLQPRTASAPALPATMSLMHVAAVLQLALATRRAARSAEHAYWYTVARGM